MEQLVFWLLKSAVWISGFALVYLCFLQNERFFLLNRIYLLAGIVASLVLPFVTVRYIVEVSALEYSLTGTVAGNSQEGAAPGLSAIGIILAAFWLTGALFVFVRYLVQVIPLIQSLNRSEQEVTWPVRLVRSSDFQTPFSFFSFVVVNPSTDDKETREILNHEMVHVRQKHWFDLLLSGMLCTVQWFNPLAWIYSRLIRQNHEYLADDGALQRTSDPALYRAALLNQMAGSPVVDLGNFFNFSLNKKRFTMMKNKISSPYRKLKLLLILPVFAIVLYAFARPDYRVAAGSSEPSPSMIVPALQDNIVKGIVVREDGTPLSGAAVVVQGTTTGTITGDDGRFTLKNINRDAVLIVSYVGFETKAVKADFGSGMTVKMLRKAMSVDTVKMASPPPPPPPPPAADVKVKEQGQKDIGNDVFMVVEEMPKFPGGDEAMIRWLVSNLKYPPEAKRDTIQGVVMVGFVISNTGKVMNVHVKRGVTPALDAEAVRVIGSMPDWTPGKQHGKAVDVEVTLPIQFKLR